jgi:hypothetical protein
LYLKIKKINYLKVLAKQSGKLPSPEAWREVRTLKQAAALYGLAEQPVAMIQWVREHLRKDDQRSPHTRVFSNFVGIFPFPIDVFPEYSQNRFPGIFPMFSLIFH